MELARSALTKELGRLVEHLAEQVTDAAGGRPKTFCDSSLEKLFEFFGRFCRMTCVGGLPGIEATEAGQINR